MDIALSKPYFRYWGKIRETEDGELTKVHLLPYHCLDVGAVGHSLLKRDRALLERIASGLPFAVEEVLQLILFFLVLHDVGKFGRAFQCLCAEAVAILLGPASARAYSHRHDALGVALWEDTLCSRMKEIGVFRADDYETYDLIQNLAPLAAPFFGHHGLPVCSGEIETWEQFSDDDVEAACVFVDDLRELLVPVPIQLPSDLGTLYDASRLQSWLLSGFAVVCDWIGSNEEFFPYSQEPVPIEEYWQTALDKADRALDATGILPVRTKPFSGMGDLFPTLKDVHPSPLQEHVSKCDLPSGPQLWIIEDITGSGKTEAALILAQRLMQHGYDGTFVALPTMATANAMYDRMAAAYVNLFEQGQRPSLALAHGRSKQSKAFTSSILETKIPQPLESPIDLDKEHTEASAACAQWIADNRKKALLAHAGVGTIDQALLSILPSRHHTLRLFGLANKVLIVDEVHACDAYMTELLKALLEFHAAMGGSAILLSATIPQEMRTSFGSAFLKGLKSNPRPELGEAFPAVTVVGADSFKETRVESRHDLLRSLAVKLVDDKSLVIKEIEDAANSGACVCWVRNTVADAIEAFEELTRNTSLQADRIMLFHARFAMGHRLEREEEVRKRFGKEVDPDQRRGAVLVATQVVEQSLDLDFDFMVSDLAPIDLLIQRAGRIHRHHRDFRGNRPEPVLWVYCPPVTDSPSPDWYSGLLLGASFVYPDHGDLWRTARLLDKNRGWTMPDDARPLIEGVYGECAETVPNGLIRNQTLADGREMAERSQGRFNALCVTQGYGGEQTALFSDMAAPTRLGEPSVTLRLVVRSDETPATIPVPICDTWFSSEVQVRESLIAGSAIAEDVKKQVCATMPDKGKWSELIILDLQEEDSWTGVALDKKGNLVDLVYSLRAGLQVNKRS